MLTLEEQSANNKGIGVNKIWSQVVGKSHNILKTVKDLQYGLQMK